MIAGTACLLMLISLLIGDTVDYHYHAVFLPGAITLQFKVEGLIFSLLSLSLSFITARFSIQYLHREQGFGRFFMFLLVFCYGMLLSANSSQVSSLYVGWEIVGLTSFLLISFFFEREKSVDRAVRILAWYKLSDFFLLIAIAAHFAAQHDARYQLVTELAFCLAVLVKSAQFPFSGWLPWALEGPSPSSAVFYGGLGVHLGAIALLVYVGSHDLSTLSTAIIAVCAVFSLVLGRLTQKVQSDAKAIIVYGVITQLSLILIEILLGYHMLAVLHIVGHAILRTFQILTVGGIIHDHPHSTWRELPLVSIFKIGSLRNTSLAHRLLRASSKEIHFVHVPFKLMGDLGHYLRQHFLRGIRGISERWNLKSELIVSLLINASIVVAIGLFFLLKGHSAREYLGLFLLLLSMLIIYAGRGVKYLGLSFVYFHMALVFMHHHLTSETFDSSFVILELMTITIAFVGLYYSKLCLKRRFGVQYSTVYSGLASNAPAAAFCMFISILSLSGFPGTLGAFSEETIMHELIHRPYLLAALPFAYVLISWAAFRRFVESFYGRSSVREPELFALKPVESLILYAIGLCSLLIAGLANYI